MDKHKMRVFKKIFKSAEKRRNQNQITPDYLFLLNNTFSNNGYENYKNVVLELEQGNSHLLLPSENNLGKEFSSWISTPVELKIEMGIWFRDGLKATAAFTNEQALFEWAKKPTKYVSLRSQMVLELCEANGIQRIVIDSNLRTMIVLQKND